MIMLIMIMLEKIFKIDKNAHKLEVVCIIEQSTIYEMRWKMHAEKLHALKLKNPSRVLLQGCKQVAQPLLLDLLLKIRIIFCSAMTSQGRCIDRAMT